MASSKMTSSPLNRELAVMEILVKLAVMVALKMAMITNPVRIQKNAKRRAKHDLGARSPKLNKANKII